jgi:hypothetical protein
MKKSKFTSWGLLAWTSEEETILKENLDKLPKELKLMLPARSENAIYMKARLYTRQHKMKLYSIKDIKLDRMATAYKARVAKKVSAEVYETVSKKIEVHNKYKMQRLNKKQNKTAEIVTNDPLFNDQKAKEVKMVFGDVTISITMNK